MNRNGKIALGCGGAGCLFLILAVIVVGILIFTGVILAPGIYSPNSNSNYNSNRRSTYNSNSNSSNSNLNSNSDDSSGSSSMSNDQKHRLHHAATVAEDAGINVRVGKKLGLLKANGEANDAFVPFVEEHIEWISRNMVFIQTIDTPEKARAYVEAHIDD